MKSFLRGSFEFEDFEEACAEYDLEEFDSEKAGHEGYIILEQSGGGESGFATYLGFIQV